MELSGKRSLHADPDSIWRTLMNPEVLEKIVPGISKLQKKTERCFESIMEISIGPINGSFKGTIEFEELKQYECMKLHIRQNSKVGNANAVVTLSFLSPGDHQTDLVYHANVKLTGLLANMGQRLIGGVADTMIRQFFSNLERDIAKKSAG